MITISSLAAYRDFGRVLIRDADFIYLLPHPGLRDWISNYTVTFPRAGLLSDGYTVIPHGCATLVFSADGARIAGSLFGPSVRPVGVGHEANRFKLLFIVEFQPAGYYAFSGMPQKELTDALLPFDAVNPALNRLIAEKLEASEDVAGLVADVDRLFLAHLKAAFMSREFSSAQSMIIRSGGLVSVKELSQNVYYSERHLGRVFLKYMGLGAKPFSRLVRVNRAARLMRRRELSLTRVYLETGFYDMPHFIRDFKAICGVTPQEYRENMSDFYSEIAKF